MVCFHAGVAHLSIDGITQFRGHCRCNCGSDPKEDESQHCAYPVTKCRNPAFRKSHQPENDAEAGKANAKAVRDKHCPVGHLKRLHSGIQIVPVDTQIRKRGARE